MTMKHVLPFIITFLLVACDSGEQNYNSQIKIEFYANLTEVKKNASRFYRIDDLYAHYPKDIEFDSIANHLFVMSFQEIKDYEDKNEYSCLILKTSPPVSIDSTIDDRYFSLSTGFKDENYCMDFNNNGIRTGKLPIPDLRELLYTQRDEKLVFSRILFIEASYGDYWKMENTSSRPECLERWKNGFSRGTGVYKDSTGWKEIYWVMYW